MSVGLDVFYQIENFPSSADERHKGKYRVMSVEGELTRKKKVDRSFTPNPPIGTIKLYLEGRPTLETLGMEGGHIVGLNIGGDDISKNVVPMFSYFNRVTYKNIEDSIYANGMIQYLKVSVTYRDDDPAIPESFKFEVKKAGTKQKDYSSIPFERLEIVRMVNPTVAPYPIDESVRSRIAPLLPPVKPSTEPYAFLNKLNGFRAPEPTTRFGTKQRTYILTANAMYNHAQTNNYILTSDAADDVHQTLTVQGGTNRPEVDHVVPRSWGGANDFANAMVLSNQANGEKRAKTGDDTRQQQLNNRRRSSRSDKPIERYEAGPSGTNKRKRSQD